MEINKTITKLLLNSHSSSSMQDYLVLYTMVQAFQVSRIVEIGTHRGTSSIAMCQAVLDNQKIPKIWTVDNWTLGTDKKQAEDIIKEVGFQKYITIKEGNSSKILPALMKEVGKVDLVFIDGDHTFTAVKQDYLDVKDYTDTILFHDTEDGNIKYYDWNNRSIKDIVFQGWDVINFPTVHFRPENGKLIYSHLVGICLARRKR